jgi:hypothetical protein
LRAARSTSAEALVGPQPLVFPPGPAPQVGVEALQERIERGPVVPAVVSVSGAESMNRLASLKRLGNSPGVGVVETADAIGEGGGPRVVPGATQQLEGDVATCAAAKHPQRGVRGVGAEGATPPRDEAAGGGLPGERRRASRGCRAQLETAAPLRKAVVAGPAGDVPLAAELDDQQKRHALDEILCSAYARG